MPDSGKNDQAAQTSTGVAVEMDVVVPVLIRVEAGRIVAFPEDAKLHRGEMLEWICFDGDFTCEFEGTSPFPGRRSFMSNGDRHARTPAHDNSWHVHKYTIRMEGLQALDPTIEADPRKRPPKG